MSLFLIKLKNIILDILFPPICINCRKTLTNAENDADQRGKIICEQCLGIIKLNSALFCPVCRARLAENKKICHRDAPYFLAAAGNYDDPVLQNLIHYFKYKSFENLAPILGELLIKYFKLLNFETFKLLNFIIVPIPLHHCRERERGFNQAKLLAEIIARHFNLPLIDGLKRIKNNEPQVKLKDFEKRIKNISDCFEIKNPEIVKGKNIILIDDVFTSGATMNEAARILKKNGSGKIIALVLAKA